MPVYLIHFSKPYKAGGARVQHYMGASRDVPARVKSHRSGAGSPLLKAVDRKGISWRVVRTWPGRWAVEKQLKAGKNLRKLCPVCSRIK